MRCQTFCYILCRRASPPTDRCQSIGLLLDDTWQRLISGRFLLAICCLLVTSSLCVMLCIVCIQRPLVSHGVPGGHLSRQQVRDRIFLPHRRAQRKTGLFCLLISSSSSLSSSLSLSYEVIIIIYMVFVRNLLLLYRWAELTMEAELHPAHVICCSGQ